MDQPSSIDDIVHRHARAVLAMDIGRLMEDLTPEAMGQLQAGALGDAVPALSDYEVLDHRQDGRDHLYDVKYIGPTSFTVRARWSQTGGEWKIVDAEVVGADPA
jgi:hypothetical protein